MSDRWVRHVFHAGWALSMLFGLSDEQRREYAAKGDNCALCGLSREECQKANETRPQPMSMYGEFR